MLYCACFACTFSISFDFFYREALISRRDGREAEGGGLLNRYTGHTVSRVRIPLSPPDFLKQTFLMSFWVSVSMPQNPGNCGLFKVFVQHYTRTSLSLISPFYPKNLCFYSLYLRYMRTLRSEVRMSSNPGFTRVSEDRHFLTFYFLENEKRSSDRDSKRRI